MPENEMPRRILDEISARFILGRPEFIYLKPEEYFFILEEAFWFATDFLGLSQQTLPSFANYVLAYNGIFIDYLNDYMQFKAYKQSIKVFGTMLFSPNFTHCLLVQQAGSSNSITFPKGKKAKNESGLECAVRETVEEVGYDARNKVTNLSVTVFEKITFYIVLNVDMNFKFKTMTRNEITKIFWFDLSKVEHVKSKKNYKIFYTAYSKAKRLIDEIRSTAFRFDMSRIMKAVDKVRS